MPISGGTFLRRVARGAPRALGVGYYLALLVLCLLPYTSQALTLERPTVNVDWDKLPQKPKDQPELRYAANRLFGTVEFRSAIKGLPQWERVLRQYKDRKGIDADFSKTGRKAELQEWEKIKASAKNAQPLQILQAVNKFF